MGEEQLQTIVRFFKALADESRLRLVGLLAGGERSVEELAALLQLTPPTVSHHLARLRELDLVAMRQDGTTHLYRLNGEALRALSRSALEPAQIAALVDDVEGEAWERKVLRDFFEGERLKEIPASRKKRFVILKWLANRFEPGVRYPENEVNERLKRHHPDAATLRRELVSDAHRLMQRDHGVYWRVDQTPAS
jgi:hypothetical protein